MSRKLVFSIFLILVFFQVSCAPTLVQFDDSNTENGRVYGHESDTVYGVDVLGQSRSFTRGGITSARDVHRLNGKILRRKGARA